MQGVSACQETDEVPAWLRNTDNAQTNLIRWDWFTLCRTAADDGAGPYPLKSCARNTRGGSISIPASWVYFNHIYCSVAKHHLYGREEGIRTLQKALTCIPGRRLMPFTKMQALSRNTEGCTGDRVPPIEITGISFCPCAAASLRPVRPWPGNLLGTGKEVLSLLPRA